MNIVKNNIKAIFLLFVYSFLLLLVLSPDSYLRDLYHRCDTAWFFMCGKAWVNGMVPYVDFADSKGPLLWLIYACGYLIHPYSYVGVFWISCLFYTVSFWFAFKLSRLFVSRNGSIVVLTLLPIALFWHHYHNEVRAEDFCYPFIFASLYWVCKVLLGVDRKTLLRLSFLMGMSMMCCLLIKWSIMLMMGGLAIVLLYSSLKKRMFVNCLYGGVIGMWTMSLPFYVYFLVKGNFGAFISEYFCNTYSTVSKPLGDMLTTYLYGWIYMKKPFALFFVGLVLFCRKFKVSYWLLFVYFIFLSIVVVSISAHYWSALCPFSVFSFILLVKYMERKKSLSRYSVLAVSMLAICVCLFFNIHPEMTFVFQKNVGRQAYYDVSRLMALTQNPKVIGNDLETGTGILADALPACRYWARQRGATPIMDKERRMVLQARIPDYIVNSEYVRPENEFTLQELRKYGYVYCGKTIGNARECNVYCKKELYRKLPHVRFNTMDLLLKKNLFIAERGMYINLKIDDAD